MCILVFVHYAMRIYLRHARKKRTDERPFFRTDVWGCTTTEEYDHMMDAAGRRFQYLFVDSPTLETCCGHVCLHNIPSQESKNEGLIRRRHSRARMHTLSAGTFRRPTCTAIIHKQLSRLRAPVFVEGILA